ncbi:AMP-binding protein [Nocardioides sp. zg-1228]|uniref:AMP-binding protein n=1 Tax=Nocardioides sp. zg-1228 TaxID=2763008 RepID=UPI0016431D36|nr:AMP-binding protein [Nocardioides sp. zg-1228]MBC2932685.1 AMP-binding protein [Nocardioides sp. zg-1228]QSF58167.1 AMP-binding protein [Nocardioides sp. zg-1228]
MPAHESPLARLERHARNRALEVAVAELRDGAWTSLTWNELYRRAIDGAAGMIEAGVDPGQVVVIRVPTGIRQLEIELATRVAGAVPLLLPERLDPEGVRHLLDGVQVRLVVVDDERRLALLRRATLDGAQLFECDEPSWERLRAMGLERRKRQPDLLGWVAGARADSSSAPVLGLPRDKGLPWLFRPEASGALSDLTAADVVLLVGEATDRFTAVARDAHLTAGCTLAWVESAADLEGALAHVSPTHLLLDHVTARALEGLLEAASVDGSPWHATPREVLDAVSAQVAEARLGSRDRRLAAEASALAPWWGGRLRVLVMDARVNRTVSALARTSGFRIGRVAHHPSVRLDLSREPAVVAAPAAPAVEAASTALPRRGRAGAAIDPAFSLTGPPGP